MVFPSHGKGGGGPVAVAHESVFGKNVEDALLLAGAEGGLVDGCGDGGAGCCEERGGCVYVLGVADVGVLLFNGGLLGLGEVREGSVDVVPEVLQSAGTWWTEGNAFVRHVAG